MGNQPGSGILPPPGVASQISRDDPGVTSPQQLSGVEKNRRVSDTVFRPHPIDPEEAVWAGVKEIRRKRRYSDVLKTLTSPAEHISESLPSTHPEIMQTSALKYSRSRHLSLQTEEPDAGMQQQDTRQRSISLSTSFPGSSMMGILRQRSLSVSEDDGSVSDSASEGLDTIHFSDNSSKLLRRGSGYQNSIPYVGHIQGVVQHEGLDREGGLSEQSQAGLSKYPAFNFLDPISD